MPENVTQPQNFNRRYYETIRRAGALANLGRVAISGMHLEELKGYERRQYDEMNSALVEGLMGKVSTHYTFELQNGKLVARDGEVIENLMDRGLEDARGLAARDHFFASFLPQRAEHERQEHLENQQMANGLTNFNTIVTFSPYTEELATNEENNKKLVQGAQKPYWQRSMLRVSHWDGRELHVVTRSIDNSSVELLHRTAGHSLNYNFKADSSTQMLGERIHLNLHPEEFENLPDKIVVEADLILSARRGGNWQQGRPEEDAENLQNFVNSNSAIVEHLIGVGRQLSLAHNTYALYRQAFDSEVYNHLALLEERLKRHNNAEVVDMFSAVQAAGLIAEAKGRVYDMCGMVIGPREENNSSATETGFESLRRLDGKKISCPECKNKVVVPKADLEAGKLSCSDCGYEVDVCSGKTKKSKISKAKAKPKQPDFFDELAADLRKYADQISQARSRTQQTKEAKIPTS